LGIGGFDGKQYDKRDVGFFSYIQIKGIHWRIFGRYEQR